jgi:iron-sulfur cluster repair protein YtfE (RIC family)
MSELQTDSMGVVETRLGHDMQRRATALPAESAARASAPVEAVTELRDFVVAMLRHHHESEDRHLWPLILEKAPELAGPFADLSDEHEQLDAALRMLDAFQADT